MVLSHSGTHTHWAKAYIVNCKPEWIWLYFGLTSTRNEINKKKKTAKPFIHNVIAIYFTFEAQLLPHADCQWKRNVFDCASAQMQAILFVPRNCWKGERARYEWQFICQSLRKSSRNEIDVPPQNICSNCILCSLRFRYAAMQMEIDQSIWMQ